MFYVGSYCVLLEGAWRTTGSNVSDNGACLSSKVYGLSWKELRVDGLGFLGTCGCCWLFLDVVGGDWCGGC